MWGTALECFSRWRELAAPLVEQRKGRYAARRTRDQARLELAVALSLKKLCGGEQVWGEWKACGMMKTEGLWLGG